MSKRNNLVGLGSVVRVNVDMPECEQFNSLYIVKDCCQDDEGKLFELAGLPKFLFRENHLRHVGLCMTF